VTLQAMIDRAISISLKIGLYAAKDRNTAELEKELRELRGKIKNEIKYLQKTL